MSTKSILLAIILLASVLRLYNLTSVPPSPSLDEVSIGYNAFSLLMTGRDEYGNILPVLLRAYDDWRPGLYAYLVIPFIPIFGLSALAVRFPSVILSIYTVLLTYFLVREVLRSKEVEVRGKKLPVEWIALGASLLLAISPWHIYLSRLGHEVNLGLAAVVSGIYFFLRALHRKEVLTTALLSSICFVLSLYGYQSQKIIVPVLLSGLLMLFYTHILKHIKAFTIAGVVGVVLLLPLLVASMDPQALVRFKATSAFSNIDAKYQQSAEQVLKAKQEGDIVGELLGNRRLVAPKVFFENYFSHFNPLWLFVNSGNEQHKVPGLGLLYVWESVFLVVGLAAFLFAKLQVKYKILVVIWLLTAPLAAAITTGAPHAMRSYTFLPVWQVLSAFGIVTVYMHLKRVVPTKVIAGVLSIIISGSVVYFWYHYYSVFPESQSSSFQYALKPAVAYALQHEKKYEAVMFSNERQLYQSYMFYLFYSEFDPRTYQELGGTKSGGYAKAHKIGKFEFQPIQYREGEKNILYVGSPADFPEDVNAVVRFLNLDGKEAIYAVE